MITDLIDLLERLLQRSLLLLRHGPRVGPRLSPLPNQPSTLRTAHTPTLAPVERVRSERHTDTQRSDQGKSGWRPQGHRTTAARAPLAPPRTKPRSQQQDEREEDGRGREEQRGAQAGEEEGRGECACTGLGKGQGTRVVCPRRPLFSRARGEAEQHGAGAGGAGGGWGQGRIVPCVAGVYRPTL